MITTLVSLILSSIRCDSQRHRHKHDCENQLPFIFCSGGACFMLRSFYERGHHQAVGTIFLSSKAYSCSFLHAFFTAGLPLIANFYRSSCLDGQLTWPCERAGGLSLHQNCLFTDQIHSKSKQQTDTYQELNCLPFESSETDRSQLGVCLKKYLRFDE